MDQPSKTKGTIANLQLKYNPLSAIVYVVWCHVEFTVSESQFIIWNRITLHGTNHCGDPIYSQHITNFSTIHILSNGANLPFMAFSLV
jgi:hypothetical protein